MAKATCVLIQHAFITKYDSSLETTVCTDCGRRQRLLLFIKHRTDLVVEREIVICYLEAD